MSGDYIIEELIEELREKSLGKIIIDSCSDLSRDLYPKIQLKQERMGRNVDT